MDGSDCKDVQAAFNNWDTDGNGKISKKELAKALTELGMDVDEAQLDKLLQEVTRQGDREIDYNSFVQWLWTGQTPTANCPARETIRDALGLDEEEEDEDEEEDDEEEEDSEEEEDEEDEEDEEEVEDDEDYSPKAASKKSPKKKKGKPAQVQKELDSAQAEIERLKAKLMAQQANSEAEKKQRMEQRAAENAAQKKRAEKERAEKEQQDLLKASENSDPSAAAPSTTEAAGLSVDASDVAPAAKSPTASPSGGKARSKKKAKRKEAQDFLEEGVVCTQELAMGEKQQIRSALGVGNDVWTIDWGGMVSIRARHDAAKIKAQINTSSFVTSMLHMQPGLMWLGMEKQGIKIIDTTKKVEVGTLTGGHSSMISCLCVDEPNLSDMGPDGSFPVRRAWSGSDDFTIRQWLIHTWRAEANTPEAVTKDAVNVETAGYKAAISRGLQLHGHKNKVRCMLKIGPCLWSGSDDGTIRIWNCADSLSKEVIQAHREGVLQLSSVRSSIWSAGADGTIREWSNYLPDGGGTARTCTRSVAPEGFEKGVYGMLPLGQEVWTCGHNPNIQVFGQQSLEKICGYEAHNPYVSKLIPVDRMVTKTVWTTSFADRKLKVWSHVVRDDAGDTDMLMAENKLHVQAERNHANHIDDLARKLNESQAILHAMGLDDMDPDTAKRIAESIGKLLDGLKDLSPEEQAILLEKIAGVIKGLSHLSAEDMANALDKVGDLLKSLGHLPAEQMAEALDKLGALVAGLNHLPPEKLAEALDQIAKLVNHLSKEGLLDLLEHLPGLVDAFNDLGLKSLLKNPQLLKKFLQAFVNQGMEHLIEDPEKMEAILKIFNDLDAKGLLQDAKLNAYTQKSGAGSGVDSDDPDLKLALAAGKELSDLFAEYKDLLEAMGIGDILRDPSQLRKLFETLQQIRSALEECGFGEFLKNPKLLADFFSNYAKVKAVFDQYGLGELLEDPYNAKGWLSNYSKIQQAFKDAGLEYLLSSAGAMKDFLAKHAAAGSALEGMGDLAARMSQLEGELQKKEAALQRAMDESEKLKKRLAAFEALGTVDQFQKLKDEMITLRAAARDANATNSRVQALERQLANQEQERLDALAREKVMFSRYKELDIFKLDIIARELKGVLKKVDLTEKQSKQLKADSTRYKDFSERKQIEGNSELLIDGCRQTEAHIHDIIAKCFSETQRRHIGVATDNEYRADDRRDGRILDGGSMIYCVQTEMESAAKASLAHVVGKPGVERVDYGSSKAAPSYRSDARLG